MGRRIPPYTNASIHPLISFSLLTACVAATMVVIAALCGAKIRARFRKSLSNADAQNKTTEETTTTTTTTTTEDAAAEPTAATTKTASASPTPVMQSPSSSPRRTTSMETPTTGAGENEEVLPLKPPPMAQEAPQLPSSLTIKTQKRRLHTSLSMKVGGMGLTRLLSKREEGQQPKTKHFKPEDSIWQKKILLGEKCKIPDEDEEAIIYDEKGNRVQPFSAVRTPRSLPASPSKPFADHREPFRV